MNHPLPAFEHSRLASLLSDPALTRRHWADRSLCRGLSPDTYFPDLEADPDCAPPPTALVRCRACPVSHECLATALFHENADGYRFGWWGGLSPESRAELWAEIGPGLTSPAVPPDHLDPPAKARYLRDRRLTVAAIATQLGCSERTVHRYLAASAA